MSIFKARRLERTKTLGERLKKVREEAGLSLDEAEQGTQIRRQYLDALERGTYHALPGPVYIESFLKRYAEFLNVSSEFVLELYHHQDKKVLKRRYRSAFLTLQHKVPREFITPRVIRFVVIGLVVLACLTYVGFEVRKIFTPPQLTVASPADFITVSQASIQVTGQTEPEATLVINGKQIFLDNRGRFSEQVDLNDGLNVISVSASKKKSEAKVLTLHILRKSPIIE